MSAMCLPYVLKGAKDFYTLSNSVILIFVFAGFYMVIKCAVAQSDHRLRIIGGIVGLLLSIALIMGANIINTDVTLVNSWKTWIKIVLFSPITSACFMLVVRLIEKFYLEENCNYEKYNKKIVFFIIWGVIFLAWIPVFCASYPGIYGYDSIFQTTMYMNGTIETHHPIAHTYLLGFFVITIGKNILGSLEKGMALYSLFQMICMSCIFTIIYTYVKKRTKKIISIILLLVFMFLPVNGIMAVSSTKDILFAGFFALMILQFLLVIEDKEKLKNWKFCVSMIVIPVIGIIFRNQEIYVFVLGMIFMIIFLKNCKRQLIMVLLSVVVFYGIYSGPITNALAQKTGDSVNEMMSVPTMQLARAMSRNADELTVEEKNLIEKYIPNYAAYEEYEALSDAMKNTFDSASFKENPSEFIKLWIEVGKEHPITYMDAFARLTIGAWYPDMNYRDNKAYHPYWEYRSTGLSGDEYLFEGYILLKQEPLPGFKKLSQFYDNLTYNNTYQNVPIVSLLFSSGCMVWGIVFYIAILIYHKRYRYIFPAIFAVLLILTIVVGPVVLYRYIYPIAMIEPLLLASAAGKRRVSLSTD